MTSRRFGSVAGELLRKPAFVEAGTTFQAGTSTEFRTGITLWGVVGAMIVLSLVGLAISIVTVIAKRLSSRRLLQGRRVFDSYSPDEQLYGELAYPVPPGAVILPEEGVANLPSAAAVAKTHGTRFDPFGASQD